MRMAGVRQFDEGSVLNAALDVFWAKGFGATSMQDLAEATGVQRGSLYNAYGGKEQLFMRVYEEYGRRYLDEARQALVQEPAAKALEAFFVYAVGSMTRGQPTRGCLTTKAALDEQIDCSDIRTALKGLLQQLETLLRDRLSSLGKGERLRVPAADAAKLVVAMTRGLVVMERVQQQPAELLQTARALVMALFDVDAPSATSERRRVATDVTRAVATTSRRRRD